MKKVILPLVMAAAVTTVSAEGGSCAMTGFYLGLSGGANFTSADVKSDFTSNAVAAALATPANTHASLFGLGTMTANGRAMGGAVDLFAGYGIGFSSGLYLGADAYIGWDGTKKTIYQSSNFDPAAAAAAVNSVTYKLERKMSYGLAARLGFMVTPSTLLYVKGGIEGGQFKAREDINLAAKAIGGNAILALPYSKSVSKNRINFLVGLGAQVFITKNFFVGAEYHYLFGPTINIPNSGNVGVLAPNGGPQNNTAIPSASVKVAQHAIKIRLGYKF